MRARLEPGVINARQLAVLAFLVVVGDSILIVPSLCAYAADQDAWISGLLGAALGIPMLGLTLILYNRYPECNLLEIVLRLCGPWAGAAVSLLYLYYFLLGAGSLIREIGDFMTIQIMPETPIRAVHFLIILVLLFALWSGLESLVRSAELFFPSFMLLFASLIVFLLPKIDAARLQPVFGSGWSHIVHGSIYMIIYPYSDAIMLAMILPSVRTSGRLTRDFLLAVALGGFAIFLVVLLAILVLGPYLTATSVYPTYALAKKINIGSFLQRVEAIQAIDWVLSTFFKAALFTYGFVLGTAQLLRLRDYRFLALPTGFILFGFAYLVAPNVSFYNDVLFKYFPFWDLLLTAAVPALLLLLHAIRGRSSGSPRPANE